MKNLNKSKVIMKFISERDDFKIDKNVLICVFCNKEIIYSSNEGTKTLKRHLDTQVHKANKTRVLSMRRLEEASSLKVFNKTFDERLVEAFTSANIPLYKLKNSVFKSFIEEYTNKVVRDESYYRKHLVPVFERERKAILQILKNEDIFLLFDETTDVNGKFILNILGGVCCKTERQRAYLIRTVELQKTNSETISQEIINIMGEIYEGRILFDKLVLILSDAASYAIKTAKILKALFKNLKHVTCLAHMLHRLCEKVREISPFSNSISSEFKHILIKNKENQRHFMSLFQSKLPKFPILTRWATWLSFMFEISENYDLYKIWLQDLVLVKTEHLPLLESFVDSRFLEELNEIRKVFFVVGCITELEDQSLSTKAQVEILLKVKNELTNPTLKEKLSTLMEKNPEFLFFISLTEKVSNEKDKIYLHVPLTTVDVERSFSKMTTILDDSRRGMTINTQEILSFLYFNKS